MSYPPDQRCNTLCRRCSHCRCTTSTLKPRRNTPFGATDNPTQICRLLHTHCNSYRHSVHQQAKCIGPAPRFWLCSSRVCNTTWAEWDWELEAQEWDSELGSEWGSEWG